MEKEKRENYKIDNWYAKSAKQVLEEFSSGEDGISGKEAEKRLKEYGENTIKSKEEVHPVFLFFKQFRSGLVYVLIAAAVISAAFGKMIDVYVITAVIFLNAIIGFVQEYKAERAIQALKEMIVPTAKVFREGELLKIAAERVVPGDVVLLEEGDRIPADARIFYAKNFRTVESSLTGESIPQNKGTEEIREDVELGDRINMCFMGTFVAGGRARGVVIATGDNTAFGSIAKDIEGIERKGGHFEEKIGVLAKQMAIFAFTGAFLIFILRILMEGVGIEGVLMLSEEFRESLLFAIAALVSGIPEGLPAILIVVLAIGATRMAKRNAIIRRLPATETLGVTDHIITDKTGTLTQNTMTVRKILLIGEKEVSVSGEGWVPQGEFYQEDEEISPLEKPNLRKLIHIAGLCNEARLTKEENEKSRYGIIGDPTEAALVVLAEKAGIREKIMRKEEEKIDDMPFSSKLKYRASLSVLLREDKEKQLYVVGAPEEVLQKTAYLQDESGIREISEEEKREILEKVEDLTEEAMRTIALAYKRVPEETAEVTAKMAEELVLVGVVGMIDPPRPEVKEAIAKAKRAGIRVIMVTGDHKGTAITIAKETGLAGAEEAEALIESDLSQMSEKEFEETVGRVDVFARVTPHMKLTIAKTLQKKGAVVAMTGDGVNDAPAVKQADIGIAMGIMGTDVTKESGEIILADDNFASIIAAVEEGRIVFTNTRQTSSFLITTNFAEFATLISSILLRFPLPLLPTQILWLNLVTDGTMGFPLAAEPGNRRILDRPPRDKRENILCAEIIPFFVLITVIMAVISLFVFHMIYEKRGDLETARTAAFTVMAFTQLFNAINMRSLRESVFRIGFFSNKYMIIAFFLAIMLQIMVIEIPFFRDIFGFGPLKPGEILFFIIISSSVLLLGEAYKYIRYKLLNN